MYDDADVLASRVQQYAKQHTFKDDQYEAIGAATSCAFHKKNMHDVDDAYCIQQVQRSGLAHQIHAHTYVGAAQLYTLNLAGMKRYCWRKVSTVEYF